MMSVFKGSRRIKSEKIMLPNPSSVVVCMVTKVIKITLRIEVVMWVFDFRERELAFGYCI